MVRDERDLSPDPQALVPQNVRTIAIIGTRDRVPSGENLKRPRSNRKSLGQPAFRKERTRPRRPITTRSTTRPQVEITQLGGVADDWKRQGEQCRESSFQPVPLPSVHRLEPNLLALGLRELRLQTSMRRRDTR